MSDFIHRLVADSASWDIHTLSDHFRDYANSIGLEWDVSKAVFIQPFPVRKEDLDKSAIVEAVARAYPREQWSSFTSADLPALVAEGREVYFDEVADATYSLIDGFSDFLRSKGYTIEDNDEWRVRNIVFSYSMMDHSALDSIIRDLVIKR